MTRIHKYGRCLKSVGFVLVLLLLSLSLSPPFCQAGSDLPLANFHVHSESPRLWFQWLDEWDLVTDWRTGLASNIESPHYCTSSENYAHSNAFDGTEIKKYGLRLRWPMSNILVVKIEGGGSRSDWKSLLKSWMPQASMSPDTPASRGLHILLAFELNAFTLRP